MTAYPIDSNSITETSLVLTKSVYGTETDSKKTPFGLLNAQIRLNSVLNNAGWFNLAGEKVGYGDLSMADLAVISSKISSKECFFALSEFDTVWNIPKDLKANEPGKDFVLKHCVWACAKQAIFRMKDPITVGFEN